MYQVCHCHGRCEITSRLVNPLYRLFITHNCFQTLVFSPVCGTVLIWQMKGAAAGCRPMTNFQSTLTSTQTGYGGWERKKNCYRKKINHRYHCGDYSNLAPCHFFCSYDFIIQRASGVRINR